MSKYSWDEPANSQAPSHPPTQFIEQDTIPSGQSSDEIAISEVIVAPNEVINHSFEVIEETEKDQVEIDKIESSTESLREGLDFILKEGRVSRENREMFLQIDPNIPLESSDKYTNVPSTEQAEETELKVQQVIGDNCITMLNKVTNNTINNVIKLLVNSDNPTKEDALKVLNDDLSELYGKDTKHNSLLNSPLAILENISLRIKQAKRNAKTDMFSAVNDRELLEEIERVHNAYENYEPRPIGENIYIENKEFPMAFLSKYYRNSNANYNSISDFIMDNLMNKEGQYGYGNPLLYVKDLINQSDYLAKARSIFSVEHSYSDNSDLFKEHLDECGQMLTNYHNACAQYRDDPTSEHRNNVSSVLYELQKKVAHYSNEYIKITPNAIINIMNLAPDNDMKLNRSDIDILATIINNFLSIENEVIRANMKMIVMLDQSEHYVKWYSNVLGKTVSDIISEETNSELHELFCRELIMGKNIMQEFNNELFLRGLAYVTMMNYYRNVKKGISMVMGFVATQYNTSPNGYKFDEGVDLGVKNFIDSIKNIKESFSN